MRVSSIYDEQLVAIEEAEEKVRLATLNLQEAEAELDETLNLVEAELELDDCYQLSENQLNEHRTREVWIVKTESGKDATEKFEYLSKAFSLALFEKIEKGEFEGKDKDEKEKELKKKYGLNLEQIKNVFSKFSKNEIEELYNFDKPEKVKKFLKKFYPNTTFKVTADEAFNKETDGSGIDKSCQPKMRDAHDKIRGFFHKSK